jgi:acyl dehydratase
MSRAPVFLDDLTVGTAWTGTPVKMTAEEIVGFANLYDPQPFHTDPKAAAGLFGGLIASGWHVAALTMRQFVEAQPFGSAPILGLGVDELRWLKPVRPGDTLTARGEVVELRPSQSRPDRGIVRSAISVINQDGDVVMRFLTSTQLAVRQVKA